LYTPEFWTAYRAAMSADDPMPEVRRVKVGSIAAVVRAYYGSTEFKALAVSTRDTYSGVLDRFVDKHGEGPIAGLQPKHINKLIDEMADTPSAASNFRKRLKGLMDYAVSAGLRSDNPVVVAKRVKLKTTGHRTWTEEDIANFRKHHKAGTALRLAFEVLLHTGLRRSDAVRLGWQHLTKDGFVISTKKSQGHVELCIPVHRDLAGYIADCPKDGPAFIATIHGRARSEKAFSAWISDAAADANLPAKSAPHGVRKAACRRLAEAGCSALEIMSITGHTDIREIERYCREAARKKLAVAAMAKLQGEFDIKLPNPTQRLGKNNRKPLKILKTKSNWRSQQDSNLQPA
jgi:site-specific recombinase XerD